VFVRLLEVYLPQSYSAPFASLEVGMSEDASEGVFVLWSAVRLNHVNIPVLLEFPEESCRVFPVL